ncbi:HAMP domain-containing sensor histidine kinase [Edaphobacter sp.]|uniref:sensor histidine kinase n=1 Tax=Edaphobacter sp. TaxID=1934404 RepID=UPI002DBB82BF|nr:HAMP domain-containing sensor histidine kinase [Edaphobacter sp.]HEU5340550.1 HAMP domain-containing sensor histidine kinase [Edaphobacter sp.]
MKFVSLRFRVTAWSAGFLAIALTISSIAVYVGVRQFLTLSVQRTLRSMSLSIETMFLSQWGRKGESWAVGETRESFSGSADYFVRILHAGTEAYRSTDLRDSALKIASVSLPADDFQGFSRFRTNSGVDVLEYVDHYTAPDGEKFVVITGAALNAMNRVLHSLFLVLLAVCPCVLFLAALAGYVLFTRPLKPVSVLTEQAENIGRGHMGERLPVPATGDELQRLANSLNRMIDRLEEALDHNHRFSADASHELRTPLTIIRGELEQAIQEPGLTVAAMDGIGSALEEIDRMSQIVQSLMAVAYLDSGEQMETVSVQLDRLAASTIEQMQLLAEERDLTLVGESMDCVVVNGNPTRLKQVIVNLVDNAMKYNQSGGTVRVCVMARGNHAVLQVADNGPGIPETSLPFIFDRFYRADKARSRSTGGMGLGLSIVKAICNAHNADISVTSSEGSGTVVTVEFPLAQAISAAPFVYAHANSQAPRL